MAAYTQCVGDRAFHAHKGQLAQRTRSYIDTGAAPCNAATASRGGIQCRPHCRSGNSGYSIDDALRSAGFGSYAALLIGNPDDMGIYNPEIREWNQNRARGRWPVLL